MGQSLGSALVTAGRTRVICTANLDARVPSWLRDGGWVTAQYAMLPGATSPRGRRDPGGRGKEIQRLIGRSLRACVTLPKLVSPDGTPMSVVCDCDVIEADGGTRTASITGAYVALMLAFRKLMADGRLAGNPVKAAISAVSVGTVKLAGAATATPVLDLPYEEDSRADVDLNVVMLAGGGLVEVQGTGEQGCFTRTELNAMLDLAEKGCCHLHDLQAAALNGANPR